MSSADLEYQYKITPENSKSITRTIYYKNTDTDEKFEVQEVYRDGYFILEVKKTHFSINNDFMFTLRKNEKSGNFPFIFKNDKDGRYTELKVWPYKIIDYELNDVTYSDADTDMIDELDEKGILDEQSRYYITGPIEIIKINS